MLVELAVRNLGVIESARVPFGQGLIALTGETGAGKTMLIEALNLLAGHKADPARVRQGAEEATVEGLFAVGDQEWVLRRIVPASGRSRAYVNGELATASGLAEVAATLLELHGQHAQQQLFTTRAHRDALDDFAGIDTTRLDELRSSVRRIEDEISRHGGDERTRVREIELLDYQIAEIDSADPRVGEDEELAAEEDLLADALAHAEAAQIALAALNDDGAAVDSLSRAVAALAGRAPYADVTERLIGVNAELSDCAAMLRSVGDSIEPNPERLEEIQARRGVLMELRRKYGETEQAVLDFGKTARSRLEELTSLDDRLTALEGELDDAKAQLVDEAARVGTQRHAAAGELAERIEAQLVHLAMPAARMEVRVEDSPSLPGAGEAVEFLISANPGVRPGSLSKVASGGELSRVMLALRLVLSQTLPTTVFDEIDAGIGGEAALEVGRALLKLASDQQVLVVTHLPQVAAFADMQIRIEKSVDAGSVSTTATPLSREDRVIELSRMMTGRPDSETARLHAEDLLRLGAAEHADGQRARRERDSR